MGEKIKIRLDPEVASYVGTMLDQLAASESMDSLRYQRFTASSYNKALTRAEEGSARDLARRGQ